MALEWGEHRLKTSNASCFSQRDTAITKLALNEGLVSETAAVPLRLC